MISGARRGRRRLRPAPPRSARQAAADAAGGLALLPVLAVRAFRGRAGNFSLRARFASFLACPDLPGKKNPRFGALHALCGPGLAGPGCRPSPLSRYLFLAETSREEFISLSDLAAPPEPHNFVIFQHLYHENVTQPNQGSGGPAVSLRG
jgi:hypothetical protein